MAAQLMAAGANQQLIAAKLEEAHEIGPDKPGDDSGSDADNSDGTVDMNEGESTKLSATPAKKSSNDGELAINHQLEGTLEEVAKQTAADNQAEAAKTAEEELAEQLSGVAPTAAAPSVEDLHKELETARVEPPESVLPPVETQTPDADEPTLGGTLNATTEQAQHDKQHEIDDDRNKTILSHNSGKYIGDSQPTFQAPFNAASDEANEPPTVDIFSDNKIEETIQPVSTPPVAVEPEPSVLPPLETLEDIDRKNRASDAESHEQARSAVELAYEATPLPTPPQPTVAPIVEQAVQEQVAPALPSPFSPPDGTLPAPVAPVDFSQLPPPPPLPVFPAPQGPTPPEQLGQIFGAPGVEVPPPVAPPAANDPNQFKIPGQ
jgi:hypothetical protein